jgi:hypothetical protein
LKHHDDKTSAASTARAGRSATNYSSTTAACSATTITKSRCVSTVSCSTTAAAE